MDSAKKYFEKEKAWLEKNLERYKDKPHPTRMRDMRRKIGYIEMALYAMDKVYGKGENNEVD